MIVYVTVWLATLAVLVLIIYTRRTLPRRAVGTPKDGGARSVLWRA
jgi:hypothetical protein